MIAITRLVLLSVYPKLLRKIYILSKLSKLVLFSIFLPYTKRSSITCIKRVTDFDKIGQVSRQDTWNSVARQKKSHRTHEEFVVLWFVITDAMKPRVMVLYYLAVSAYACQDWLFSVWKVQLGWIISEDCGFESLGGLSSLESLIEQVLSRRRLLNSSYFVRSSNLLSSSHRLLHRELSGLCSVLKQNQ
jgi:hypothetical protein